MAERRMFAKQIIDSDAFIDMPQSSQNLYFHLAMRADDDGFINNPKKIMRMIGASEDDLKILLAKRYILGFESGVVVIKHWRIHNYIQKDRYKPTMYVEEAKLLQEKENGSYTECIHDVSITETCCTPRLGKDRLGKDKNIDPPTIEDVKQYAKEKAPSVAPQTFFDYYDTTGWVDKNDKPIKNWKLKMITWHNKNVEKGWTAPQPQYDPAQDDQFAEWNKARMARDEQNTAD